MLDGTTAEIVERKALRINAAKTCQPIGAMYAAPVTGLVSWRQPSSA